MTGAIRYRTYINGTLEAEHETLQGVADYLFMENALSERMYADFLRNAREAEKTDDLIYEMLWAYVAEDPYSLTTIQHNYCRLLYEAVEEAAGHAKGGTLSYTIPSGDRIRIESVDKTSKSPSRKPSAGARKPPAKRKAPQRGSSMSKAKKPAAGRSGAKRNAKRKTVPKTSYRTRL